MCDHDVASDSFRHIVECVKCHEAVRLECKLLVFDCGACLDAGHNGDHSTRRLCLRCMVRGTVQPIVAGGSSRVNSEQMSQRIVRRPDSLSSTARWTPRHDPSRWRKLQRHETMPWAPRDDPHSRSPARTRKAHAEPVTPQKPSRDGQLDAALERVGTPPRPHTAGVNAVAAAVSDTKDSSQLTRVLDQESLRAAGA